MEVRARAGILQFQRFSTSVFNSDYSQIILEAKPWHCSSTFLFSPKEKEKMHVTEARFAAQSTHWCSTRSTTGETR